MTKNEFKIGDRVRDKENPCRFGVIASINHYNDLDCLVVRFDNEDERVCYVTDLEIYPDRKTAFLSELRELMRKYDAKIESCAEGTEDSWIDIYFGDECVICFDRNPHTCCATITADNIMEFDK